MDLESPETVSAPAKKSTRGKGRGGRFFALDRDVWARLWKVETVNRLNLVTAYLVLLAGTGSDHQLTKWSAKAIEEYVGIGKPRGQAAIEELVKHKIISRTEQSTRLSPQYRLAPLDREADPIFLPVQLITGLAAEASMLRRIREIGDPLLLRMLIDLYGMVQIDAAHGIPLSRLRDGSWDDDIEGVKLFEMGANTVWALECGTFQRASGDWASIHKTSGKEPWSAFWERVANLKKIGALVTEYWIFDSTSLDAEPLFPVDPANPYGQGNSGDAQTMTSYLFQASAALAGDRTYYLERGAGKILVPLPGHHSMPGLHGVAKLRVEPDTPGRRRAYALRMNQIEGYRNALGTLINDAIAGNYGRPLVPSIPKSTEDVQGD